MSCISSHGYILKEKKKKDEDRIKWSLFTTNVIFNWRSTNNADGKTENMTECHHI